MENTKVNQQELTDTNQTSFEKKRNTKKIILISASIAAILILTAILVCVFVCFHNWTEATCTAPVTCSKCGATQGEPLNENDFIKNLASGLDTRWEYNDADEGKTPLTTTTASVDNWKAGEKSRFVFDTSEEFETMTIEYASWNY